VHLQLTDFKKAYDLVRKNVLYNIFPCVEIGMPTELVRLIKMCLNENYCKVNMGKYLSGTFLNKNGLQQVEALSSHLFNFAVDCHL
jgi:hypothetical protein